MQKAAIFVFTYDPQNVIKGVTDELQTLSLKFPSDISSVPMWLRRLEEVEAKISEYGDNTILFHFAGHASDDFLQFNQDIDEPMFVNFKPFADNLKLRAANLKLIFLNGCSTKNTAHYLAHEKGVPAVIGTNKKLKDEYGIQFASKFYTAFVQEKKDLNTAFELAQNSLKQNTNIFGKDGKIKPEAFQVRGIGFDEEHEDDENLYTLHRADDGILNATFADWLTDIKTSMTTPKVEANKLVSMGKDTEGYLLCNRTDEISDFEKVCRQKRDGQLPEPQFFFYHDETADCPELLPNRFSRFLLPELCGKTHSFREILLPSPTSIQSNDPLSSDFFKVWFTESFDKEMGKESANANELLVLKRRPPEEQLLVIHHPLNMMDWYNPRNPAMNDELKVKLKVLFEWYIGTYSAVLQTDFSERLVVIVTARYTRPNTYFPLIFKELQGEFPSKVKNIADLLSVLSEDVDSWQQNFFKTTTQFDATQLVQNAAKMMNKPDWQNTFDLPFINLIEPLKNEIIKYNSTLLNAR